MIIVICPEASVLPAPPPDLPPARELKGCCNDVQAKSISMQWCIAARVYGVSVMVLTAIPCPV